jgi:hypothetical protein
MIVQIIAVTAIAITEAAMAAVVNQPKNFSAWPITNCRITAGLEASSINMTMIGTATTPFITALQNKALATILCSSVVALTPALAQAPDKNMDQVGKSPMGRRHHHHHPHWMRGGNYHHSGTRERLNRGASARHPEGAGNPTNGD